MPEVRLEIDTDDIDDADIDVALFLFRCVTSSCDNVDTSVPVRSIPDLVVRLSLSFISAPEFLAFVSDDADDDAIVS